MDVLISGASVAGPVTAYWLRRQRLPGHRRRAGSRAAQDRRPRSRPVRARHWRSRADGCARPRSRSRAPAPSGVSVLREGARRPSTIDLRKLMARCPTVTSRSCATTSARSFTTPPATTSSTSSATPITCICEAGEVTFAHGGAAEVRPRDRRRRPALRRARARLRPGVPHTPGSARYLAVLSTPTIWVSTAGYEGSPGVEPARAACTARPRMPDARAIFLFRTPAEPSYDRHDGAGSGGCCASSSATRGEIPRLLDETDRASAFYFDSITQLRLEPGRGGGWRSSATPGTARARRSGAAPASPSSARTRWRASSPRRAATPPARTPPTRPPWGSTCGAAGRSR